ncbi:TlpA disulfide reductase family protein [Bradyrhizobium sp. STM 3809]|uniref:TlpA family protein disulfide reductase n=1 Tax=Bradyrhizobium sp. STM 3809 TaxID=551936 RepID=UPI0002409E97|nr:TlpA disulfide reductase family protein [Bradyrhizobium sp. STM 3809]CCE03268.1 putative thiol-disulfide oxidoreductase (modular protein) [Bradyrhizobium sp. STM 3809]
MADRDQDKAEPVALASRRRLLQHAATLGLTLWLSSRAAAQQPDPPLFGAGRSQFILERPRRPLPPLRLQDLTGHDVQLAPKPGRVTLVNLWATWCAACKTDLPTLAALDKSQLSGLDIWSICADRRDIKTIRRYAQEVAMPRASFADPHAQATHPTNPDASVFALPAMPITYLIGTGGLVEGYITGAPDWLSPAGQALLRYYLSRPAA